MNTYEYKLLAKALIKALDTVEKDHRKRGWRDMTWTFMRTRIEYNFQKLRPRDKQILTLRFGLEDGVVATLQEIADQLELSKERVRQIEGNALTKLAEETLIDRGRKRERL